MKMFLSLKKIGLVCTIVAISLGANAQEHKHDDGHSHGESSDLGTTTVLGIKIKATQEGKLDGKEGVFEFEIDTAETSRPESIRVWIGNESGRGSTKSKATSKEAHFHDIHVELPKQPISNSRLWLEMDTPKVKKIKASFGLKK